MMEVTTDVIDALKAKHPEGEDPGEDTLLYGPINHPEDVIYQSIDGKAIYSAAIETHGSAGPSGVDAEGRQRFLCSRAFGQEANNLCEAVARLARKIATKKIDPTYLSAYTACRLIALDKQPGIRPVGVGETLRRIIGKALSKVIKNDVAQATAPIQSCGGVRGGAEAAVHALRNYGKKQKPRLCCSWTQRTPSTVSIGRRPCRTRASSAPNSRHTSRTRTMILPSFI